MQFIGIDLAWAAPAERGANDTGVVSLDKTGRVLAAGWTVGIRETATWIEHEASQDTLVFVDAPLLVRNASGQRLCETHVGQRYGRWKVSANSTNLGSPRLAGIELLRELEERGWTYSDGLDGPPRGGRIVSECYPYTAIVGAEELGYATERPRYKRSPKTMKKASFRPLRAAACDELIERIARLETCDPCLHLRSHPETARLVDEPSPLADQPYKKREDLLDAALCAWTAALWWRFGETRCQVLGVDGFSTERPAPTIIAPARDQQRTAGISPLLRNAELSNREPVSALRSIAPPTGNGLRECVENQTRSPTRVARPRTSKAGTTTVGYVNRNRQTVVRATELPGNDHLQRIYVLRCGACQHEYGANGSDIHLRRCPLCQDGAAGLKH